MKLDIYVNYPGNCEQAFRFYEQHLGGKITSMLTHQQVPGGNVPEDWKNAILHARIEIGDTVLMGADIPNAEPMRSAYLTLRVNSATEAEQLYTLLITLSVTSWKFLKRNTHQVFFSVTTKLLKKIYTLNISLLSHSNCASIEVRAFCLLNRRTD